MCEICAMTSTFDPTRHPGEGPLDAVILEDADAPSSISTPYSMAVGDTFEGSLTSGSDTTDYIAVTFTAGTTYEIAHMGSTGGGGTLSDPYLRLLDDSGAEVGFNDDGGAGLDSLLTFTATSSGTYYIEAGSYANAGSGTYTISVTAPEPVEPGSLDDMANFLTHGYWGGYSRSWDTSADNIITVNITALTAEGQQLARWAFEAWEMVADIRFVETTGSADMTFDDDQSGAYASSSSGSGNIYSSNINVSESWLNNYGTTIDSYPFQTYVHEIGHALGLGHQGGYNGSASYGTDEEFVNDSWQMSVMSYFSQTANTSINASYAFVLGPMMSDIVAIQNLYGAPTGGAEIDTIGDTTWGANSNLGGYLGAYFATLDGASDPDLVGNRNVAFTIYDHSGNDTLDTTFTNTNNRIDMRDEQFSNVDGLIGNIGIARDTVLENVISGGGNDTITGNDADNRIAGGGGNDSITGGAGTDTVVINATRASATIVDLGGGQVQIVSSDGSDIIDEVEFFEFNDGTVDLDELLGIVPVDDGGGDAPEASIENSGSTGLSTAADTDQYVIVDGTDEIGVTLDGNPVSPTSFTGWSMLHAEASDDGGYQLLWQDTNTGEYDIWLVDANGAYQSSLTVGNVQEVESFFDADIDGDGTTGMPATVIETEGLVDLATAALTGQYTIVDGADEIGVTIGGIAVSSSSFAGWSMLHAEASDDGGYQLLWQDTNSGQYALWVVDANGAFQSSSNVSSVQEAEFLFDTDIDGDDSIGAAATVIETEGLVGLGTAAQTGQYTILDGADEIGVTINSDSVSADSFAGWSMLQAEATGDGGYRLLWQDTNSDQYTIWVVDANGVYQSSSNVANVEEAEFLFDTDIDGNGSTGMAATVIETEGLVDLATAAMTGQYTIVDGADEIGVTIGGIAVSSSSFAGWSMLHAEVSDDGGYQLLWQDTNSQQYAIWIVDANGAFQSSSNVSNVQEAEFHFDTDIDGDQTIGADATVIETDGLVDLATAALTGQYTIVDGADEIGVTINSDSVTADSFDGWSMLHAEASGDGGYQLLWQDTNTGQYDIWEVDANGVYQSSVTVDDIQEVEPFFGADIDGDGSIGLLLAQDEFLI